MYRNNRWQSSAFSMPECLFSLCANSFLAGKSEVGNKNDGKEYIKKNFNTLWDTWLRCKEYLSSHPWYDIS
jgi:hypothetical protein